MHACNKVTRKPGCSIISVVLLPVPRCTTDSNNYNSCINFQEISRLPFSCSELLCSASTTLQSFTPAALDSAIKLEVAVVKRWHAFCGSLNWCCHYARYIYLEPSKSRHAITTSTTVHNNNSQGNNSQGVIFIYWF